MRGIVELEVLDAIRRQLPSKIPIQSFFDLIVGTRYVHWLRFSAALAFQSQLQPEAGSPSSKLCISYQANDDLKHRWHHCAGSWG